MRKFYSLIVLFLFLSCITYAQQVPRGMKYQAVARDKTGEVLSNKKISLMISLMGGTAGNKSYYTEVHELVTNQFGLFDIVIGEGKVSNGDFSTIPWSAEDIWMQVAIKDNQQSNFTTISNSKLLAVPYAFHAFTANELVPKNKGQLTYSGTPYNFSPMAATATNVGPSPGIPAQVWSLKGNSRVDPTTDRLGTTDYADLVMITNNIERLRITADGNIAIQNKLTVGNDLTVKQNVNLNTEGGTTNIKGATTLSSTLSVTGATALNNKVDITGITTSTNNTQSTAINNGALIVTGGAGIGGNVNVGGATNITGATNLQNTLDVTGATHLKNKVTVDSVTSITNATQSTAINNGALVVTGGVGIGGNLNVGGATSFGSVGVSSNISAKGLNIVNDTANYLATFQNTNTGEGDGIKIKLGRAKSSYTIPAAPTVESSTDFADLLNCNFSEAQKVSKLATIVANDAVETAKTMAGIAVSAGNMIINVINSGLNLPLSIPDITVPAFHVSDAIDVTGPINTKLGLPIVLPALSVPAVNFPALTTPGFTFVTPKGLPNLDFPGIKVTDGFQITPAVSLIGATTVMPTLPALTIPALDVPQTTLLTGRQVMPKLPKIDLTSIGIPEIDISSLKFWGLDINICLDEATSSPLNNSNEFIRFADKNDAQVGSIRGVSVTNWAANYLNPVFFAKLRGAFLSSKADKFHAQYHFKQEISTALASYAKIGVEYSSGNGDYAEWLERSDKMEAISAGDIVSVKGGKITKDLVGAEQVMVVSHAPIMLGNMPAAGKTDLGNSIVFIGQAPVKILGPVRSGDYVIGQMATPGYGLAKHPADMTIEDFKLAVGRSWDADETEGIKMANTVIGIHNSSFLNLIKDLKEKAENNDTRLAAIEAKLNLPAPVKKKSIAAKNKK